jgi:hypothetical protein
VHEKVARSTAADFLRRLVTAVPFKIHKVLTDNGTHERISRETVRRRLAENDLKPWRKDMWCIPQVDGEYVARMEDVLDLYAEAPDPKTAETDACLRPDPSAVEPEVSIHLAHAIEFYASPSKKRRAVCAIFLGEWRTNAFAAWLFTQHSDDGKHFLVFGRLTERAPPKRYIYWSQNPIK